MDETQKGMQSIRNSFGGQKPDPNSPSFMDQVSDFLHKQFGQQPMRDLASVPQPEVIQSAPPTFNAEDVQNVQQSSGFQPSQDPNEIKRRAIQQAGGQQF